MTKVQDDNTPYKRYVVTASASVPNAATGTFNEFIDTDNTTKLKSSSGVVTTVGGSGGGSVSDLVYGVAWNGVTGTAPSQNAVYDKIESLGSGGSVSNLPYDATTWNGVTGTAPSQDAVRDKFESLSTGGFATGDIHEVELFRSTLASPGRFDFSSIPATYDHLIINILAISTVAASNDIAIMIFNNDTGANYTRESITGNGASITSGQFSDNMIATVKAASGTAGQVGHITGKILNYAGTTFRKTVVCHWASFDNATNLIGQHSVTWTAAPAAINRITIQPDGYSTDNFGTGSFCQIIGVKTT